MKNTLMDLNNHLFAELERLGDEELAGEELKNEGTRAKAISEVSKNIVENAKVVLEAQKFKSEFGVEDMPRELVGDSPEKRKELEFLKCGGRVKEG